MIDDVDNVEMCLCINSKWRIIKERYRQLEPENKNLHQRLANLTLWDDGITDLKGTYQYKQGQREALKPNAKDYFMNRVHFCPNLDQVE